MQKLQLYIEGQRVDLFKDESVSLTQTLQNVKDIGKIFTEFTKTFAVPASSVNNKIFKHYYNFDISGGYDARIKQAATLELNDLPFKQGAIKLNGVKLKNNVAHTYNITFFGNTINLKDILAESQLSSLSGLAQYNKIYSFDDVVDAMQNAENSGNIIVPLITHTNRLIYDSSSHVNFPPNPDLGIRNIAHHGTGTHNQNGVEWNQFKYAIKLQAIIDAIEAETFSGGKTITFSNHFFNKPSNTDFSNLFLWLHRKKGSVDSPSQVLQNFTQVTELGTTTCVPTTNCQPSTSNVSNGILALTAQAPYSISFLNLDVTPPNTTDAYTIRVIRDGSQIVGEVTGTGNKQLIIVPWNDSTYSIQIASSTNMVFPIGGIQWSVSWTTGGTGFGANGQMLYSNAATFTTTAFKDFNINEQMPKMTIMEFLSGLFKMFNLTAYVDNAGTIVVRTLDSYYEAGTQIPINIDKYLDTSTSAVNVALPFKSVKFQYKGLSTFLAKQFEQINNLGWGTLSYTLDGNIYDAPTKEYTIELPFEHMQYERLYDVDGGASTDVQWGYFVDDNQESYFGSPLLFYPIRQSGGTSIRIRDTITSNVEDIDDYYIPSNSLATSSNTSKVNIHFGNEINEYQANEIGDPLSFTDTLFMTKYINYIKDVFNLSRRITKVTAYLPMKIYYNLKLNDLIQLGQNNYKINSLTTNLSTGKTQFELLNDVSPTISSIPTAPTGLNVTNLTSTSVTFCWNASSSAVIMRSYQVYQNGTQQSNIVQRLSAIPISSTYCATITGLTSNTSYSFYVSGTNDDGEESALSSVLTITTP
jgi:hypothetical protein